MTWHRSGAERPLPLYYIGPDWDLALLDGLSVARTGIGEADVALCIGLVDDLTETPADYADRLAAMRAGISPCSAPIPISWCIVATQLCWCAGALAQGL